MLLVSCSSILALLLSSLSSLNTITAFGIIQQVPTHTQNDYRTSPFSIASSTALQSTPFDASMYENEDINPFTSSLNPLAAPLNTKLVVGLNKYSHDTALCAADASTGEVLFAMSKERLSRKKHDGGNVATLVEICLEQLELELEDIVKVVVNNHHHRVLPMEESFNTLEWEDGMGINGGSEEGYIDEENLLSHAEKLELSHHLAHAYSAASQCPFNNGMVVVMDGMGETYRAMRAAKELEEKRYVSDLAFEGEYQCIPVDIKERSGSSIFDWREGESVYEFVKDSEGISVKPIFKRFVEEKTPPALYNHGFENMDSVGAIYSRASSHIFGNWNTCGKVMGLAPWMGYNWSNPEKEGESITAKRIPHAIMKGKIYEESDESFQVDRSSMMGMPFFARLDPDLFNKEGEMTRERRYDFDDDDDVNDDEDEDKVEEYDEFEIMEQDGKDEEKPRKNILPTNAALDAISLAALVQDDLESTVMSFVKHFKGETKQENLCLAGGVALNSVLNGRLSRELGFKKVFVPPYPGDDGIAVGCCAYGLYSNAALSEGEVDRPKLWSEPLSPYLGCQYTNDQMRKEIEAAAPWLEVELVSNDQERFDMMTTEIESGGVIAWYQGRSELGPRALGHRSILADPRKKGLVRFLNEKVKKRESFRPFAPSVLLEEVDTWFEVGKDSDDLNFSPFMSMTAMVKQSKRELIPAVTHVDGSSRLQTVAKEAEPLYHGFISNFFKRTGIPMVLNTSFNTLPGEPIVESPKDAIRSFMCSMGSIDMLVMGDYVIRRKDADVRRLLGEKSDKGVLLPATFPRRAGPVNYESKFTFDNDDTVETVTRVRMPDRPMHNEKDDGWFTLLDDFEGQLLGICSGSVSVNDILSQYYMDATADDDVESEEKDRGIQEALFSNTMQRLVRLYEHSLISW